jgi:hypothetical protein
MAQRVEVTLIDDLDGKVADETVSFMLDGTNYEIDLSTKNASKLRDVLEPFRSNGRKLGRSSVKSSRPPVTAADGGLTKQDREAMRRWFDDQGRGDELPTRGRLPGRLITEWREARAKKS